MSTYVLREGRRIAIVSPLPDEPITVAIARRHAVSPADVILHSRDRGVPHGTYTVLTADFNTIKGTYCPTS